MFLMVGDLIGLGEKKSLVAQQKKVSGELEGQLGKTDEPHGAVRSREN